MPIKIADHLDLPEDAATQVYAFMGRRGSGKTFAAGRLVEQLHAHGDQVVILDPVGTWYGLRLAADGKAPGLKIHVFGGNHGDLPFEVGAGKVIAELVAERGISLVLDVSGFKKAEQRRFVADFAEELFHAKKRHRSALMVVLEEVQEFCPQHVTGDAARMVGAIESMIKLGRNYGVGAALLSQRPQAVNKDILNLSECLLAFQLTGPQERKTIEGWVREKGADGRDELGDELPSLPVGTAMIWSPQWLQHFGRHKILAKKTFDASATPTFGKPQRTAVLAPIDLEAVREAMAATIEQVKANDPRELKAEVAKLRRELEAARAVTSRTATVEVPTMPKGLPASIQELHRRANAVMSHAEVILAGLVAAGVREGSLSPPPVLRRIDRASPPPQRATNGHASPARAPASGRGGAERKILQALASRRPDPLSKGQVATLAGYAASGGGFNNALSALKTAGLIRKDGDIIFLTPDGLSELGPDAPAAPAGGEELVSLWTGKLPGGAGKILRWVASQPGPVTKDQMADAVGMDSGGGGFNNYVSSLRSNGLIEKAIGGYRIKPDLAL